MHGVKGSGPAVFVAGDTGHVGHAFIRQLAAHVRAGRGSFRLIGTTNTRRLHLTGVGKRARRSGDWGRVLAALRATTPAVFVDCTASEEVAALYPRLLGRGIGVVTPNKLAFSGPMADYRRLCALAAAHDAPLGYETTAGAALPVLAPVRDLAARGEHIVGVEAVLSGTLSFIFARLNAGVAFSRAVLEARELGYTEPHPARDLDGMDTLRKLVILLRAGSIAIEPEQVALEPLLPRDLADEADVERFLERLVTAGADDSGAAHAPRACIARYQAGEASIGVVEVAPDSPFASLAPGANLVRVHTARYRALPLSIGGPGAGAALTAAGLLTDLIQATRLRPTQTPPAGRPMHERVRAGANN